MKNEIKNLALHAEYPQATRRVPKAYAVPSLPCYKPHPYGCFRRMCRRPATGTPSVES
jgi:hypothetical protein